MPGGGVLQPEDQGRSTAPGHESHVAEPDRPAALDAAAVIETQATQGTKSSKKL